MTTKAKERVVLSLHVPRDAHQRYQRAARRTKQSVAAFLREAAEKRVAEVMEAPPTKAA